MDSDENNDGGSRRVNLARALRTFETQLNAAEEEVDKALQQLFSNKKPGYISGPIVFSDTSGHAPYELSCTYHTLGYNKADKTLSFSGGSLFNANSILPGKQFASIKPNGISASFDEAEGTVTLKVEYEGPDIDSKAATSVTINKVAGCKGPTGDRGEANSNTDKAWQGKSGEGTATKYGKNNNYKIAEASLTGASNSFKGMSGSVTGADISAKGVSFSGSLIDLSGDVLFSLIAGRAHTAVGNDLDQKSMSDEVSALKSELTASENAAQLGISKAMLNRILMMAVETNPYGSVIIT